MGTDGTGRARHAAVLALAALVVAGTAACSANAGGSPPVVNVGGMADGVTVTGEGEVTGTPDTLTVSFGVSLQRDSVDQAVADNAAVSTKVQDALKANGVAEADIQTRSYSVQPQYRYDQGRQTPEGYRVDNTVTAKVKDLKGAGGLMDTVVAAGGNDVRVQGVAFSIEDDTALLAKARDKAFADAKAKADQYANLSGRKLGPAQGVSEVQSSNQNQKFSSVAAAIGDAPGTVPTPVNPGSMQTTLQVTVRYSLT